MTYRIESANGVTAGPYPTRAAAEAAARRTNERDDGVGGWRPVPESAYAERQPPMVASNGMGDAACDDCPPVGYPTDKTRCGPCPRRFA